MNKLSFILIAFTLFMTSCQQELSSVSSLEDNILDMSSDNSMMASSSDISDVIDYQLNSWNRPKSRSGEYTLSTVFGEDGTPSFFVINFVDNNGFMLVGATKTFYPILAYSETGNFSLNESEFPDGLKDWFDETKSSISTSKSLPLDSIAQYKHLWDKITFKATDYTASRSRAEGDITDDEFLELQTIVQNARNEYESKGFRTYSITEDVTNDPAFSAKMQALAEQSIYPLYDHEYERLSFIVEYDESSQLEIPNMVSTTWGQEQGYNRLFVKADGSGYKPAGCGPVALGQLFYYYKYPTDYDWDNMIKSFQSQAAAELLYDIAICAGCDITNGNANFNSQKFQTVFQKKGYNYMEIEHNCDSIVSNIRSGKPVVLTGMYRSNVGHAWLATGVKHYTGDSYYRYITFTNRTSLGEFGRSPSNYFNTYYFYMNWGDYGNNDGFYNDYNLCHPDKSNPNQKYYDRVEYINVYPINQ